MNDHSSLQLYSNIAQAPDALAQITKLGEMMAKSGMFGCTKIEQGVVLAMACITQRMTPIEVAQRYHIIEGKLSKKAGAALAEFKSKGGCVRWIRTGQEPTTDPANREAVGEFSIGDGDPMVVSFSMEDARNAGLIRPGSAWEKMPWKMLRARVVSDAIGMLAPEIYFGDDFDAPEIDEKDTLFGQRAPIENPEPPNQYPNEKPKSKNEPVIIDAEEIDMPAQKQSADGISSPESAQPEIPTPGTNSAEQPTPAPAATQPHSAGGLSDDVVHQIEQLIRNDREKALAYLRKIKWLEPEQGLDCLPPSRAKQIIDNSEAFLTNARKVEL